MKALEDFGVRAKSLEGLAAIKDAPFEVWAANGPALRLFLAMDTQWRCLVAGKHLLRTGYDYGAIEATARLEGIEVSRETFQDLRFMEGVALEILNGGRS